MNFRKIILLLFVGILTHFLARAQTISGIVKSTTEFPIELGIVNSKGASEIAIEKPCLPTQSLGIGFILVHPKVEYQFSLRYLTRKTQLRFVNLDQEQYFEVHSGVGYRVYGAEIRMGLKISKRDLLSLGLRGNYQKFIFQSLGDSYKNLRYDSVGYNAYYLGDERNNFTIEPSLQFQHFFTKAFILLTGVSIDALGTTTLNSNYTLYSGPFIYNKSAMINSRKLRFELGIGYQFSLRS